MPTLNRFGISAGGPSGGGAALFGQGETWAISGYVANASQSTSVATATAETVIYVVPGLSVSTPLGVYTDTISGSVVGNINQIRAGVGGVALAATLANTTISFFLRRAGAVVGGGAFAGWASASNAAIGAYQQVAVPFLTANTALQAVPPAAAATATNALLPVQAGDVVTLSVVTAATVTVPWLYGYIDIT